jgi:hypothetical protein
MRQGHPAVSLSLPFQIKSCELLKVSFSDALKLDFKALFELANAGLLSIARGRCGARGVVGANLPGYNQARRRAETARRLRPCGG